MFNTIVQKLVAIAGTITELSTGSQVFDHEPVLTEITKDPFVTIVESGNDSQFASTSENRRTFAYTITVFIERRVKGTESADSILRTIMSSLINALDNDYTLTGTVLTSRAAPSSWGYVLGNKEYRVGRIDFKCIVDYSLTP